MRIIPSSALLRPALLSLALLLAAAPVVRGQGTPGGCAAVVGPDSGGARPGPLVPRRDTTGATLRILASVSADEVRFVGQPTICVRLTGDAQLDSVRIVGRRNLASPVVANTTYRNVYVAVEIVGHLNAECIATRITGAPADSTKAQQCASLGVQGRAGPPP